jgi:hypothetical protein
MNSKLLECIGEITVAFAQLEGRLSTLISSFITDHQRIGMIITAQLPFKTLRAIAVSLGLERLGEDDDDFKTLKKLMVRAGKLENSRNEITHSLWLAGGSAGTATRLKTTARESQGLRHGFHRVTEIDLAELGQNLRKLTDEITHYWVSLVQRGKAVNNTASGTGRWRR